jgi:hypothetical protein
MSETKSQAEVVEQTAEELKERLKMNTLFSDKGGFEITIPANGHTSRIVVEAQSDSIQMDVQRLMMNRGFVAGRIENTDDGFKVTYNKVTEL